jgi:hypothetical protein
MVEKWYVKKYVSHVITRPDKKRWSEWGREDAGDGSVGNGAKSEKGSSE